MQCPEAAGSLTLFVPGMVISDSLCPEELTGLHQNLELGIVIFTYSFLPLKLLPVLKSPEIRLERSEIVCWSRFFGEFSCLLKYLQFWIIKWKMLDPCTANMDMIKK